MNPVHALINLKDDQLSNSASSIVGSAPAPAIGDSKRYHIIPTGRIQDSINGILLRSNTCLFRELMTRIVGELLEFVY